jgi:predicted  nucleic acid-binding Zn-ribbon protein
MRNFTYKEYKVKLKNKHPLLKVKNVQRKVNEKLEILHICKKHGEFYKRPKLMLLLRNKHGCNLCGKEAIGKALKKEVPFKEYKQLLREKFQHIEAKDVKLEGKYLHICKKHGEFYSTRYSLLRKNSIHGCPKCGNEGIGNKLRKNISSYNEDLIKWGQNVRCLEEVYLGASKYHKHECLKCGNIFKQKPDYIRYLKLQACPICSKGHKTEETYLKHLSSLTHLKQLENYKGWTKRIKHKCLIHKEVVKVSPFHLYSTNRSGCLKCGMSLSQRFKLKKVIVRNKQFEVQGYEEQGLIYLLNKYQLKITQISNTTVPTIDYTWKGFRKYHADFFIKSLNLLVEIKSTYTLGLNDVKLFNRNKAKYKAVLNSSFKIVMLVIMKQKVIILPRTWIYWRISDARNKLS